MCISKHRKTCSTEEWEKIVRYYIQQGVSEAYREFGVSIVSIYNWKVKVDQLGKNSLQSGAKSVSEREIILMLRKNEALKRLVSEKKLAI